MVMRRHSKDMIVYVPIHSAAFSELNYEFHELVQG